MNALNSASAFVIDSRMITAPFVVCIPVHENTMPIQWIIPNELCITLNLVGENGESQCYYYLYKGSHLNLRYFDLRQIKIQPTKD